MKTIIPIIFAIVLCSCGSGEPSGKKVNVTRILRNESGYSLAIRSYYNSKYQFEILEYTIDVGEEYSEQGVFYLGGVGEPDLASEMEWTGSIDSVLVVFGGLRSSKHCVKSNVSCVEIERSIILDYTFSGAHDGYVKDTTKDETYVYTITAEDFEKAKPL